MDGDDENEEEDENNNDKEKDEEEEELTLHNIIKEISFNSPNKKSSSSSSSSSSSTNTSPQLPSFESVVSKSALSVPSILPNSYVKSSSSTGSAPNPKATRKDSESGGFTFNLSDDEIGDDSNASNQNMQMASTIMQTGVHSNASSKDEDEVMESESVAMGLLKPKEDKLKLNLTLTESSSLPFSQSKDEGQIKPSKTSVSSSSASSTKSPSPYKVPLSAGFMPSSLNEQSWVIIFRFFYIIKVLQKKFSFFNVT